MKRLLTLVILAMCCVLMATNADAQERFGRTLNLGIGAGGFSGYSRYAAHFVPVLNLNYEIDVARNFTLAPSISFYSYSDSYYWSNDNYTYRETVVPISLKGTYYFDELLEANTSWDFYAAASAGFALVNSRWEAGYDGDRNHFNRRRSVFLDLHAGAEYHFNKKVGVYLDLSSGVSTIGFAFHQSR